MDVKLIITIPTIKDGEYVGPDAILNVTDEHITLTYDSTCLVFNKKNLLGGVQTIQHFENTRFSLGME